MTSETGVLLVQALYTFTGANNDELCFKKGDLIVVTQKEEGGWWEGTFDGNTGWFPSNYAKEYKPTGDGSSSGPVIESPPLSPQQTQHQTAYHSMVSKDIVDSEKHYVEELQNIFSKYLTPLKMSDIISEFEYKQLIGNLEDVLAVHYSLLRILEEQLEKSCKEQRIGGTFLKLAPNLQSSHKIYIANHPKAVCVIEKYKDELNSFMESQGAARPGTLVLTTALSQPFRRLDKYPGVLQEFQRHIDESHPDRGDTQRSTHIYRELTTVCNSIRRQKQLELEVLTNKIYGWDGGETLSILGEIIHMRSVALLPDNRDRYLVLFPECLVILALSSRASSFIFEGKYMLADLTVNKLEDAGQQKNAFEISGYYSLMMCNIRRFLQKRTKNNYVIVLFLKPRSLGDCVFVCTNGTHMDPIIAVCQSSVDQNYWTETLQKNILNYRSTSTPKHQKSATTLYNSPPAPPAHGSPLPSSSLNSSVLSNVNNCRNIIAKPWSLSCLRPSPPLRPGFSNREDKRTGKSLKKKDESWHEDDALILRVIEYYCTSAKTRYTVNSTHFDNHQVLIASEEKLIVEETRGNQIVLEEKSLVDTVYALKDQLTALVQNYQELKKDFDNEKKTTQNLKNVIRQHLTNLNREDPFSREPEFVI